MGPMRAASSWRIACGQGCIEVNQTIQAELFGSVALTGQGHGTERAVILGPLRQSARVYRSDGGGILVGEDSRNKKIVGVWKT